MGPWTNIVHVPPPPTTTPYTVNPSRRIMENDWAWLATGVEQGSDRLGERRHISLDLFTGWRIHNDALEYPTCKSIKQRRSSWAFLGRMGRGGLIFGEVYSDSCFSGFISPSNYQPKGDILHNVFCSNAASLLGPRYGDFSKHVWHVVCLDERLAS